ncbi:prepilin-type N-terminal cleavage/methylation domain-containing protein [Pseudomonas sp. dw_612]|uniref:PilW family protein n=1 Tax=Pseudomonas sp. dw_612 TaxID=2720080 RepID=UPI001BD6A8BF|nr:prepilin-type N-terminal cleavage/methylation domain-containing protein [Pseudomonas sp. dw_612]
MNRSNRGFGLIEVLIALALSLIVVLGVAQVFIAAKNTYVSQNAAAAMQEDARFVLSKMIQEIRMVGMFGCLGTVNDAVSGGIFTAGQTPIVWDEPNKKLTLLTADVGTKGGTPTWTVVSECGTSSGSGASAGIAYVVAPPLSAGQIAFPIRRLIYSYNVNNSQLLMGVGTGTPVQQVLVNNVSAFDVSFGVIGSNGTLGYNSAPSDMKSVRSVRLILTLKDPNNRVRNQTYTVVAAVRNLLLSAEGR